MCQGCVSDTDGKKFKKIKNRKRERHTSNLLGLVLVNEESMVSGIKHLSPGKSDNETLVFSLLYVCEEKQKEQEQEFKYDLSKAKGNFAQMRTEFDEFDWSCILDTSINKHWQIIKERIHDSMNKNIPTDKCNQNNRSKPVWITGIVRKSVKRKYNLYMRFLNTNKNFDYRKYLDCRNECNKIVKKAKREYKKKKRKKLSKESKANPKYILEICSIKDKVQCRYKPPQKG